MLNLNHASELASSLNQQKVYPMMKKMQNPQKAVGAGTKPVTKPPVYRDPGPCFPVAETM